MAKKPLKTPKSARRASRPEQVDAAIAHAAMKHRKHPVVRALGAVAELADQPPLIAGCVAVAAAGALSGRTRLLRAGLRMLASELAATALKGVVKHHVNRTRPHKMLKHGRYSLHADGSGSKDVGPWNSFPSGHTAGAVAVGRALLREYPSAAPYAGAAMALVALVQVPRGAHFPSDVAAGALAGMAAEAAVHRAAAALA